MVLKNSHKRTVQDSEENGNKEKRANHAAHFGHNRRKETTQNKMWLAKQLHNIYKITA